MPCYSIFQTTRERADSLWKLPKLFLVGLTQQTFLLLLYLDEDNQP